MEYQKSLFVALLLVLQAVVIAGNTDTDNRGAVETREKSLVMPRQLKLEADENASAGSMDEKDANEKRVESGDDDEDSSEIVDSSDLDSSNPEIADVPPEAPLATVYISTVKPGLGSSITETVFKENSLVGVFNTCRLAPTNSASLANYSDCFLDDAYNDRLTFEITYAIPGTTVAKAFEAHPPQLKVLGGSSSYAAPEILNSHVEPRDSNAKITVSYLCYPNADTPISLSLEFRLSEEEAASIVILWTKSCASGINTKIEFGYIVEDQERNKKETRLFDTDSSSPLTVPPSDVSTEVYAKLQEPGAQQAFLSPLIVNDNPEVVAATVRGNHPSGGVLQGLEAAKFQVSYECLRKGESNIQATVGIPPFQNISGTWKKECGGQIATKLSVGSSEGEADIVEVGMPTTKYRVDIDSIGTAHSDEHLHLPGNQSDWTIYLTYGHPGLEGVVSKDSALHMGRVIATVENPSTLTALAPKVSSRSSFGYREVQNSENVMRSGDKFRITFQLVCRKIGESRVLVTIPLLQYDKLEFGIAKECTHVGVSHKSNEWVLTVGNVFWGFLVVVVGGFSLYYLKLRNKLPSGFDPLPTVEK